MKSNQLAKKERFLEISLVNVFLCMLVVFIHVSAAPLNALDNGSWQYVAIMIPRRGSSFVVQGFIFLSGLKMFLSKPTNFSYWRYLAKRFLHVFLPYIIWVVIYYLYFVYHRHYFPFRLQSLARYIFVGDIASPFYYIITIAQFYVLAPLWRRIVARANPAILVAFALIITVVSWKYLPDVISVFHNGPRFIYQDRVFTSYLVFWIGGCVAGLNYERFKKTLRDNRAAIISFFSASLLLYLYLCYQCFSLGKSIAFLEDVRIAYCIGAILSCFCASSCFANRKAKGEGSRFVKAVSSLDRISYSVFLIHCLVIFEFDYLLSKHASISIRLSYLLRLIVVYSLTVAAAQIWRKIRDAASR